MPVKHHQLYLSISEDAARVHQPPDTTTSKSGPPVTKNYTPATGHQKRWTHKWRGFAVIAAIKKGNPQSQNDSFPVCNGNGEVASRIPTTGKIHLPDTITICDWSSIRLLSTTQLNKIFASYLIVRREDRVDIVSKLSAFEIYSADNLHKYPHCRLNGKVDFYPTSKVGDVVLNIGNKVEEFIDLGLSKSFYIA